MNDRSKPSLLLLDPLMSLPILTNVTLAPAICQQQHHVHNAANNYCQPEIQFEGSNLILQADMTSAACTADTTTKLSRNRGSFVKSRQRSLRYLYSKRRSSYARSRQEQRKLAPRRFIARLCSTQDYTTYPQRLAKLRMP